MSSSIRRRNRLAGGAALLALLTLAAASGPASAQVTSAQVTSAQGGFEAPRPPLAFDGQFPGVHAAPGGVQSVQQPLPEAALPRPLPPGATISDAAERVRALSAEGNKSLDDLVGDAVSEREREDVEAIAERRRRIMLLEDTLKEAKLAKAIHEELNGRQEPKDSPEVKKLEEEKAALEQQLKDMSSRPQFQLGGAEASPVVSSISGAPGSAVAVILVPYAGMVNARVGTVLPNGMKVVSIAGSGVIVERDGSRSTLPFGDSVPRVQVPPTSQNAAAGIFR